MSQEMKILMCDCVEAAVDIAEMSMPVLLACGVGLAALVLMVPKLANVRLGFRRHSAAPANDLPSAQPAHRTPPTAAQRSGRPAA